MNSKCVLWFFFAVMMIIPAVSAGADMISSPATAEPGPSNWSSVLSTCSQPETTRPIVLPFSNEIDQNQPSGPAYMAGFSQGDLAQSFMQTNDNISGAGILLMAGIGGSDNVTIQLWDGLPNASGTMITEGSATGTQGQWVDVYWSYVPITPATTYYLVFTGNTSLGITGDLSNPYPDGCVYANPGYNPFSGFDYAFRTYYETEVNLNRQTWAGVKTFFN